MAESIEKRLRYFDGQFLREQDFNEEQAYYLDRARRHQRLLHSPGIAEGLAVDAGEAASQVAVSPGTAVDGEGRQIVLAEQRTLPLTGDAFKGRNVFVVLSYSEIPSDPAGVGGQGETRWHERPEVEVVLADNSAPPADTHLRLARLQLDADGKVAQHDPSVRSFAGVRLGSEVEVRKLTLSREGVSPGSWPALTCSAPQQVDVTGGLRIGGDLEVGRPKVLLSVKNDGRAGIGTADPEGTLEVNSGAANVSPTLGVSTPNREDFFAIYGARQSSQNNDLLWRRGPLRFGTATTFGGQAFSEKMRITADGNVGIGVPDPGTYRLAIRQEGSNTGRGLRILNAESNRSLQLWVGSGGGVLDAEGPATLHLRTAGQERLFIANAGNVGLGTVSPKEKLEVTGNLLLDSGQPDGARLIWAARDKVSWRARNNTTLDFFQNEGTPAVLTLAPGGNVGIGAQGPAEKLHVGGNTRIDGILRLLRVPDEWDAGVLDLGREEGKDDFWHIVQRTRNQNKLMIFRRDPGVWKGPYLTIATDGKVGIGTENPAAALHVTGVSVLAQESWKAVTFESGWRNYGGPYNEASYMKDSLGFVHLRGLVTGNREKIFTLPDGYRPARRELFGASNNNAIGRIDVTADGEVLRVAGTDGWISLDGLTFQAGFARGIDFGPVDVGRFNPGVVILGPPPVGPNL